jgi:hypothetical protein
LLVAGPNPLDHDRINHEREQREFEVAWLSATFRFRSQEKEPNNSKKATANFKKKKLGCGRLNPFPLI